MDDVETLDLGTILGVWAHPDDEGYLSAGLMAMAVRAGLRVVCVTATRGELGSPDPATCPPAETAALRTRELAAALATLGVHEHHFLDYPDGACAEIPLSEGTRAIASLLDEVVPDTVLTFGPEGMTGHPDHRAVSRWVTDAVNLRARRPRLEHATLSERVAGRFGEWLGPLGVYAPGTPPHTPPSELSIECKLAPEIHELKIAAMRQHASQVDGLLGAIGEDFYREFTSAEYFRRA